MLEGVQPERRNRRGIRVTENTEDPAFLAQSIVAIAGKGETIDRGYAALMCQRHLRAWAAALPEYAGSLNCTLL